MASPRVCITWQTAKKVKEKKTHIAGVMLVQRAVAEGFILRVYPTGGRGPKNGGVESMRKLDHLLGIVLPPALIECLHLHDAGVRVVLLRRRGAL